MESSSSFKWLFKGDIWHKVQTQKRIGQYNFNDFPKKNCTF